MTALETPFIIRITKHLHWIEKFLLLALGLGAILTVLKMDGSSVIMLSLSGLATVFFLYANRPLKIDKPEGEQSGFTDLLALAILPKVLWISCSVSTIGILFYMLNLGNESHASMLMIGASTIFMGLLILGFCFIIGVKYLRALVPLLIRAAPVLLIDFYILFK